MTWTIENFTCYGLSFSLKSPTFNAYSKEWCIVIQFWNTIEGIDYITLGYYKPNNNFNYLYSILDSEGTLLTWTEVKDDSQSALVRMDELLGPRKTSFLPNNTLTIQCRIFKKGEAFSSPLLRYMRTRIQSHTYVSKWEIIDFLLLPTPRHKEFLIMTDHGLKLNVTLILDAENKYQFSVCASSMFQRVSAICKVRALDATTGKKIMFAESEHCFRCKSKPWQFSPFFEKGLLMHDFSNLFMPNRTLTLIFEITLSTGVAEYSRMEDSPTKIQGTDSAAQSSSSTPPKTVDKCLHGNTNGSCDTLSRDLLKLYETGILSDCNLRVGDATFPVHKQVLCARSPKFGAMFTASRKRKWGEIEIVDIEIEDADESTLRRMIRFMYTDALPKDLDWNEISKLYVAADKYKLKSLRDRCAAFLKSGVCVSNVCEILVLADSHNDVDLKSAILDFIMQNHMQVIDTEQWKKLEDENSKLTSETFRALYLKNMDK